MKTAADEREKSVYLSLQMIRLPSSDYSLSRQAGVRRQQVVVVGCGSAVSARANPPELQRRQVVEYRESSFSASCCLGQCEWGNEGVRKGR